MNSNEEQRVDLLNIIWEIIMHYRSVLAVAVIFAIMLGGYRSLSIYNEKKAEIKAANEAELKEDEEVDPGNLTDAETRQVQTISKMKKTLSEYQNYIAKSPLMNGDQKNLEVLRLTYLIDLSNSKYVMAGDAELTDDTQINKDDIQTMANMASEDICTLYTALFDASDFKKDVVKKIDNENLEEYPSDLILTRRNNTGNVFNVYVVKAEGADYRGIAELIKEYMDENYKDINSLIDHKVTLIKEDEACINNDSYGDIRLNNINNICGINDKITAMESKLSDAQKSYLDSISEQTVKEEEEDTNTVFETPDKAVFKWSLKSTVLGFVLGIVIMVVLYFLYYIFSSKLKQEDQILDISDLMSIGVIKSSQDRRRHLSLIDSFIEKLRYKHQKLMTAEEAVPKYADDISLLMNINGYKSLGIIGTISGDRTYDGIVSDLSDKLAGNSIDSEVLGSISTDPASLLKANEKDAVIIVEKVKRSNLSDIRKELVKAKAYSVNVIGEITIM